MFYFLPLRSSITLQSEFTKDSLVVFQSPTLDLKPSVTGTNTIDNTALNFVSKEGDLLIHISFRRPENAIVFNTLAAGGGWGSEERVALAGLFVGPDTTITVYDLGDRFQILIDYHTVKYYVKRVKKNATSIAYNINSTQTSPFSDPLAVTTYDSLSAADIKLRKAIAPETVKEPEPTKVSVTAPEAISESNGAGPAPPEYHPTPRWHPDYQHYSKSVRCLLPAALVVIVVIVAVVISARHCHR